MEQLAKSNSSPARNPHAARKRLSFDLFLPDTRRREAFEVLRAYYEAVEQGLAPAD